MSDPSVVFNRHRSARAKFYGLRGETVLSLYPDAMCLALLGGGKEGARMNLRRPSNTQSTDHFSLQLSL